MNRPFAPLLAALGLALFGAGRSAADSVVDFNDVPLAPNSASYGYDPSIPVGGSATTHFQSGGASFSHTFTNYGGGFTGWDGTAVSNVNDPTTAGFTNQFAAVTGTGYNPASGGLVDNYAVVTPSVSIGVAPGQSIAGLYVTNTTYAALSMTNGDGFAKQFGGISGSDADWFKLTASGKDANGNALASTVDFYLADFRFVDNSKDYIVNDWRFMDLSALADASSISFRFSSSDVGAYGMNTPAYAAIDNLVFRSAVAVPEPATLVMSATAGLILAAAGARRR
ncbi:DUF4465 domain-containing protein [Isosphaeraceae bacterium EP7]